MVSDMLHQGEKLSSHGTSSPSTSAAATDAKTAEATTDAKAAQ